MILDSYEVNVTPIGYDLYEVSLYRNVGAGICGPFSKTVRVADWADVASAVEKMGFRITGPFSPLCSNGFSTATVEPLR